MEKKKIISIIVVILLLCVGIASFFTFHYVYLEKRYAPFLAAVDPETESVVYQNSYLCGCAKPTDLFNFRGNLYVSYIRHAEKSENGTQIVNETGCDLIIYVEFPKSYTVLVQPNSADGTEIGDFQLSESMELLDESDREKYEEYYDEIRDAYIAAHEVFGILDVPEAE